MKKLVAISLLLIALPAMSVAAISSAVAAGQPAIQPVSVSGYTIAWEGTGWAARAIVTFSVSQQGRVYGLELRTTDAGTFEVGIKHLNLCYGEIYRARDLTGDDATIVGDPMPGTCVVHPWIPRLVVLKGRRVLPNVTAIDPAHSGNTVAIQIGDAVYFSEPASQARWTPSAPDAYFSLIGHATVPSPAACAPPHCGSRSLWEWVGVQSGDTAITFAPTCSTAPCPEQPDIAVPVEILPMAGSQPAIQPVQVPGFFEGWLGTGWAPNAIVTFSLSQRGFTYGLELRTTKAGTFEIGINDLDLCFGDVIQARDLLGHETGIVGDPVCPKGTKVTTPRLVVIHSHRVHPKVAYIFGTGHGKTTVIHMGGALYLWEKGTSSPAWVPTASDAYFSLIGHERAPGPAACAPKWCDSGFFWEWIGLKAGKTVIALQPWCNGGPCPQDVILALPVTILPE
ncbi:MAG TPA: hypothetical protein VG815_18550 [Chloroflexota bacterium]|nr:hypothetical protein [Chloroflexota bacterium]